MRANLATIDIVEITSATPVLSTKRRALNELFLASYHLRSYGGCEFGCPYCDGWALNETPLNTQIQVFPDQANRLAQELGTIPAHEVLGLTHGEPYQPIENRYRATRHLLQVITDYHRPVVLLTKSPTVCDDIPILSAIHQQAFAVVVMSLVTCDRQLAQHLEGRTPPPEKRLQALATLKAAGIPCGIAMVPVFPYFTDQERELRLMFQALQRIKPDFFVWDTLWIPNEQHARRIRRILSSFDTGLISRYDELYQERPQPSIRYRQQLDRRLLALCERAGVAPRIPEKVYADTLPPDIVTELRKRNQQFVNQNNENDVETK